MGYKRTNLNPVIPGLAGGLARILAVIVTSPLELIRTKKMSAQLSYKDLLKTLRGSVKSDGLRSLWRGLIPTIWRDLPFSSKLIVNKSFKSSFS
jgi:solute carrier family 25 protein 39/40